MKNTLIIGDVHSCYYEMVELIEKAGDVDDIIFTGDLLDRGPSADKVLDFAMNNDNVYSVLGNHEDKFLRYLIGNKVEIGEGLQRTIDQTKDMDQIDLTLYLLSLPLIIKVKDNYVFHAGINPTKSMHRQQRQTLLMGRKFNPDDGSFEDRPDSKYWHEFDRVFDGILFFGHHEHPEIKVAKDIYSLDGHCVFGGQLRGILVDPINGMSSFTVKAKEEYFSPRTEDRSHCHEALHQYEDLVDSGHLRRIRKDDLVMYTYTPIVTYERYWNDYTKKARGIVFDSKTGEIVCNPMQKFYNEFEHEPLGINIDFNQPYRIYNKLDGSLIHIFYYNDRWWCTSKGSFESPQALKAYDIIKKYDLDKYKEHGYTFIYEIIYPENKIVVDYGDKTDLILLTVRDNKDGDLPRWAVEKIGKDIGMQVVEEMELTIDTLKEKCKTEDKDWEGGVIHFDNGSRMKSKNMKYLEVHKVVSNSSPLALWGSMVDGKVRYLDQLPEEHRHEVEGIAKELEANYAWLRMEIFSNFLTAMNRIGFNDRKKLSEWIFNNVKIKHPHMVFSVLDGRDDKIDKYILDRMRPKGNVIL